MTESIEAELNSILPKVIKDIGDAQSVEALAEIERSQLGKKGQLRRMFSQLGKLPPENRRAFGSKLNTAIADVEAALSRQRDVLSEQALNERLQDPHYDPTLPGVSTARMGTLHPLTLLGIEIREIFASLGFHVLDYPEAESDYYNFEALNIPPTHPAREMQDTFWLDDGNLLRTHTSSGQVRAMKEYPAPFRAIFPGRVFRYERTDASHEHTFHQVEGLYIDKDASVANLLSCLQFLLSEIFHRHVDVRLRPGYFPFVEPGFELDLACLVCNQAGCSVCKRSGWVELIPCGLVHPAVLRAGGLDPERWQGWAFGLGLSRLVMMRYKIEDIRLLLNPDVRFLHQFDWL